mmetsp:Transcript_34098/g.80490  ORF Transcript_34098/g.80490 Transcript_34098/m.80490 type:complete len:261 (+) Transcript_34098:45-827(+)
MVVAALYYLPPSPRSADGWLVASSVFTSRLVRSCTCTITASTAASQSSSLLGLQARHFTLELLHPPHERRHRLLHVLGRHVHLDVHLVPRRLLRDDDVLLRVRDEHEVEPALLVIHVAHGQARPIDRDEALGHDVWQQSCGRLHAHPQRIALGPHLLDEADVVDVPLHHVAAVAAVDGERTLQVDRRSRLQVDQVGQSQCLWGEAKASLGGVKLGHGEADAVHGDAATELGGRDHLVRLNHQLPSLPHGAIPQRDIGALL